MALLQQPVRMRSTVGASKTPVTGNGYREPYQRKAAIDRDTPVLIQDSEETKAALGAPNGVALVLMQFLLILLNSMGLDLKK